MGGLCATARLTAAGKRVLLIEKSGHLGGRCSHRERDGFRAWMETHVLGSRDHAGFLASLREAA